MGRQRAEGLDHQCSQSAWGLLLARTDWDQPKHRGLSYFILDMKQPGVTVQPLRQMNGYASFNQVFFTDAKVEPEFLVSDVGNGWAVTTTTADARTPRRRRAAQLGNSLRQVGPHL